MSYRDYGKLEDGNLARAQRYMIIGETSVLYPSDALLRQLGYKRVDIETPEETPPEGRHWEMDGYEETDDEIRGHWVLVEDPEPSDEDELEPSEVAEILLGGEPL